MKKQLQTKCVLGKCPGVMEKIFQIIIVIGISNYDYSKSRNIPFCRKQVVGITSETLYITLFPTQNISL